MIKTARENLTLMGGIFIFSTEGSGTKMRKFILIKFQILVNLL